MAAPMSFAISKSFLFFQTTRTVSSQAVLCKYNIGRSKKRTLRKPPLDELIRVGKHENDVYETGMEMVDRFVDPTLTKKAKDHPEAYKVNFYAAEHPYGVVHDKKPFPLILEAGKRYQWCACGRSRTQPICDGTHKLYNRLISREITSGRKVEMFPMIFEVEEDGEYWLCNCKQSKNRPFCDGTHRKLDDGGKR